MWLPKNRLEKKDGVSGLVAVAIDKKKGSQTALKWAVDNLLMRSATVILIHVKLLAPTLSPSPSLFVPSKYHNLIPKLIHSLCPMELPFLLIIASSLSLNKICACSVERDNYDTSTNIISLPIIVCKTPFDFGIQVDHSKMHC